MNSLRILVATGATVAIAVAGAGCSSSGSKATPIVTVPKATTTVVSQPTPASRVTTPRPSRPNAAQLAAAEHALGGADADLTTAGTDINNADVNQTKNLEGSAP